MARPKITKQTFTMVDTANRFLKERGINDFRNEAFIVVEQMLIAANVYRGHSFVDDDDNVVERVNSTHIKFNAL